MYTFQIADSSAADLRQWQELRTDIYQQAGYLSAEDLGRDGIFRDPYDEYSIHVLARDSGGFPVGCVRMIEGRLGELQVTHEYSIDGIGTDALEVSGCVVVAEHRRSMVTLGLYRSLFELAGDLGYRQAFMVVEQEFLNALADLGLPLMAVSEPKTIFNTVNVAAVLTIADIVDSMAAADRRRGNTTRFGAFFADRFDWTLTPRDLLCDSAHAQGANRGR